MKLGLSSLNPFNLLYAAFDGPECKLTDFRPKFALPEVTVDIPSLDGGLLFARYAEAHQAWDAARDAAMRIPANYGMNLHLAGFESPFLAKPEPAVERFPVGNDGPALYAARLIARAGVSEGGVAEVLVDSATKAPAALFFSGGQFNTQIEYDNVITPLDNMKAFPASGSTAHNPWQGMSFEAPLVRHVGSVHDDHGTSDHHIPVTIYPSLGDHMVVLVCDYFSKPGAIENFMHELSMRNVTGVLVGARNIVEGEDEQIQNTRDLRLTLAELSRLAANSGPKSPRAICGVTTPSMFVIAGEGMLSALHNLPEEDFNHLELAGSSELVQTFDGSVHSPSIERLSTMLSARGFDLLYPPSGHAAVRLF